MPLLLALANNDVTAGEFAKARRRLDEAAGCIETEEWARVYRVWHGLADAKLAMTQGRFGDALSGLARALQETARRGLARAHCVCLLSLGEVSLLLNQLPEANDFLSQALKSAIDGGFDDLRTDVRRLAAMRSARTASFDGDATSPAGHIQAEMKTELQPSAPLEVETTGPIISGDMLADYTLRESLVYSNLRPRPEEAREDLEALWADFGGGEVRSSSRHAFMRSAVCCYCNTTRPTRRR